MEPGRLNPRDSARFIFNNFKNGGIFVDDEMVGRTARMILEDLESGALSELDFASCPLHPKTCDRQTVDWIFLVDLINFSFWTEKPSKFAVTYNGTSYDGYYAGCACVNRALDRGIPLIDAKFMSTVDEASFAQIFVSDNGSPIPLVKERVEVVREAGRILLELFDGSFYNALFAAQRSSQKLLDIVVSSFPSFHDFAIFRGQEVSFLKRAQILVADIHNCFRGGNNPLGQFTDIGELTMFADYRVPQALGFLGVLNYSENIIKQLREECLLENGSELEVALRGFAIHACDKIVEQICALRSHKQQKSGVVLHRNLTAIDVDVWLWLFRRKNAELIEQTIPPHRCRCIYY